MPFELLDNLVVLILEYILQQYRYDIQFYNHVHQGAQQTDSERTKSNQKKAFFFMTGKLITLQLWHEISGGWIFGANFVDVAKIRESMKSHAEQETTKIYCFLMPDQFFLATQ